VSALPFEDADDASLALREIVADRGLAALSDPAMLTSMLSDLLPAAPGVARILTAAAADRVADALRERVSQGLDAATAIRATAAAFQKSAMFAPEICSWVVDQYAIALGLSPTASSDAATVYPHEQERPVTPPVPPRPRTSITVRTAPPTQPPEDSEPQESQDAEPQQEASGEAATRVRDDAVTQVRTEPADPADTGQLTRGKSPRWLLPAIGGVVALALAGAGVAVWSPWDKPELVRDAVLTGGWTTSYRVLSAASDELTYKKGKTWSDLWQFSPDCSGASGACDVRLSAVVSGPDNQSGSSVTAHLVRHGAVYTGTGTHSGFEFCDQADHGNSYPETVTFTFRINVTAAATQNSLWAASAWKGTMTTRVPRTQAGSTTCAADTWVAAIKGSP
jgi:hypothetical protein